jgi:hypothetical protein
MPRNITITKNHKVPEYMIAKATGVHNQSVANICTKFVDGVVTRLAATIGYEQAVLQAAAMLEEEPKAIVERLKPHTLTCLQNEVKRRLRGDE